MRTIEIYHGPSATQINYEKMRHWSRFAMILFKLKINNKTHKWKLNDYYTDLLNMHYIKLAL